MLHVQTGESIPPPFHTVATHGESETEIPAPDSSLKTRNDKKGTNNRIFVGQTLQNGLLGFAAGFAGAY